MTSAPAADAHCILVVENSPTQAKIICQQIESRTRFATLFCSTLAEVREIMETKGPGLFMAVLNLSLKDAPDGEAVDFVLARNIPSVILTTTFDEAMRNRFLEKHVLDFLDKADPDGLDALIDLVERFDHNRETTVLLADDSPTMRAVMRRFLAIQNLTVLEAADGRAALDLLTAHPEIRLLITDYEMPVMDGLTLITQARALRPRDRLSIIGVSALDSGALTARFLKHGANDFLKKPFEIEEFICRVHKNLAEIERLDELKHTRTRDDLTGLSNLGHFLKVCRPLAAEARGLGNPLTLAAVGLDGVWETVAAHGFEAGEVLTRHAATLIEQYGPWAALAREGRVFFLLSTLPPAEALARLRDVQKAAGLVKVPFQEHTLGLSLSLAACRSLEPTLEGSLACLAQTLNAPAAPGRTLFL